MTKTEFFSELESMLEIEANTIQGDEILRDLPGWDSMAVLSFIALADEKFSETVAPRDLAACETVSDLMNLIPGKIER